MKTKLFLTIGLAYLLKAAPTLAAPLTPASSTQEEGEPIFELENKLPFDNLGDLLTNLLTLAFFVAGVAMFFMLVIGGIQWISSGGDPKALDAARSRITNAVVGLIIVVAAFAIALILEKVLGINIVSGFNFSS
jgi:hypothetical protein